jgi:hypothetical protein
VDFSCFGYHPYLESRLTIQEKWVLEWGAIAGILIGLGTTICAGLRSDEQALGGWTRAVRILAVVFPAVGTAVAAITAVYATRDELLRGSQSLAALQQINTEFQLWLSRESCPKDAEGIKRIVTKLEGWEDKLSQQLPATTAIQKAALVRDVGGAFGGASTPPQTQPPPQPSPPTK